MLTMTETWMSGRGRAQQQDHHDLYSSAADSSATDSHRNMRSSLGQLIERSISAPPTSDSYDESSSNEYSMRGSMWPDSSPMPTSVSSGAIHGYDSQSATPIVQNGRSMEGGMEDQPFGGALFIQEQMDNSGRATAPSTYWDSSAREPHDSSGRRSADPPSRSSLGAFDHEHHYLAGGSLLSNSLGLGLQRSHSAAPSFASSRENNGVSSPNHSSLGPPPGLPRLSEEIPRPASAGLLDPHSYGGGGGGGGTSAPVAKRPMGSGSNVAAPGALRPAAKTLMDLIQEDMPAEENDLTTMPPPKQEKQPQAPQPYFANRMQQQQQHLQSFQQQSQPARHNMYDQDPSGAPYNMMPQQPTFNGNVDSLNYGMQSMSIKAPAPSNQMYIDRAHIPQRYIPSGFDGGDDAYGSQSNHQQIRQVPQTMPLRQQVQQQQPERVYYTQQAQAPQQTLDVQAPRLQAQILPNGQTVYVQAAPQPAQGLGYTAAMPFSGAGAPSGAPTQLYQRSDGQFVSVVPVHTSQNAPMTFWQADGATGQAVLVSGSAGGNLAAGVPHGLMSAGRDTVSPGHGGGRHPKGAGGGRQRRNERHSGRRGEGKSGGGTMCSPVVEEFRSNKNRQWTIPHIEGHIVEFCQDQNGSRFIQQRLEMGDLVEQAIVIREVLPAIRRLRNDVFGNYVVQKLLDFGTPEVRADIRDTLEGEMMQLSLQMYGCRVVQKALETITEEDLSRLLHEFHHNVLSCIYDQNGNHVIQKCIEVMSSRAKRSLSQGDQSHSNFLRGQIDFIISDVLVNAASLSCHPYGCRVLQRILEHCDDETKHKILDEVKASHKRLLDDQYGNYVIQHVLQFGRTSDRDSILQIVVNTGLLGLSRQKFASNVVEKLLKYGNATHRRGIAAEMLKKSIDMSIANQSSEGTSVVLLMVRDAYANYVVQTTLDVVPESEEKRLLVRELKAHSDELVRAMVSTALSP
uniref:PUM-HD domain-containing protein n=1 Tax=Amphora coffeiformis TaxID=265554 RepID=A0A7S3P6Q3_9STRA